MSIRSVYCKIILIGVLLPMIAAQNPTITVDANNCLKTNITGTYPNVPTPNVRYYLFKSNNLTKGIEIKNQNVTSLQGSTFNKTLPTRIYISGYKTYPQDCKTALLKDAYLKSGSFNFILVDWSDWNTKEYLAILGSINDVGKLVGNFTNFLNANGVLFSSVYLIGHDLGAHVAGAAGESITPNKYATIYGLDPANFGFDGTLPGNRLDPTDAVYVEVISTDIFFLGYGSIAAPGHAVFYANNGRRIQPFCPKDLASILDSNVLYCSHNAAIDYFANSLNPNIKFCGRTTTWLSVVFNIVPPTTGGCSVVMGGEPSLPKAGLYYVPVSNSGPLPG